jgi:hypothetical protein
MGRVKAVAVSAILLVMVLMVPCGATTVPDWMLRPGTIGHALTLSDNARVYLDAVVVEKIKAKQNPAYFTIHECFSAKDKIVVLTRPSQRLSLGMNVDVEGTITTLGDGRRALTNVTVYGYTDKNGALLLHGPLIKGLLKPTPWPYRTDLTERSTSPGDSLLPSLPGEPNTSSPSGPCYYPFIYDVLHLDSSNIDGALIHLQCKPIVEAGSDPTYGRYFVLGEDHSSETLKVYCQQRASVGDRINKISGQLHYEGTVPVLCVDAGPGYDHQVFVGRADIVSGGMGEGEIRILTDDPPAGSIPYAKTFEDTESVTITGKIVSANRTDFPDALYVQEPSRASGIRVIRTGSLQYEPLRGDSVTVTGTIGTGSDKEREISAASIDYVDHPGDPLPLGMPNRSLGGSDYNVYTPGVNYPTGSGTGLHNKGLLVKSWGRVTAVDSVNKFFYIDDGTGFQDGSGNTGVKVSWDWTPSGKPVIVPPLLGWYVSVVGISGSESVTIDQEEVIIRVLRPRTQNDITVHDPQDVTWPDVSITTPSGTEVHKPVGASSITVAGTATDSETGIVSVEVKIDSGQWQPATYDAVNHTWSFDWQNPQSGKIWARATDFAGHTSTVSRDVILTSLVFVNGNLLTSGNGSTWATGKKTIQEALSMATSGSEVWVMAVVDGGCYTERITVPNGVALYGGFSGSETTRSQRNWNTNITIIDGNQTGGSVVTMPDAATSATRIDGFTIRNGRATNGAGAYCTGGSPVIANNTIIGNMATAEGTGYGGGGIYVASGNADIHNNRICGNSACFGGGIYCWGNSPKIFNNTIVSNSGSEGGGIGCYDSCSASISNNIIAFNSSGIFKATSGSVTLRNNCVYENGVYNYSGVSAGTGDTSVDPKLASVQYANLHIQSNSPCINAGYDAALQSCTTDADGQIRVQGSHVDIGADESNGTQWSVSAPKIIRVDRVNGRDYRNGSTWALAVQSVQQGIELAGPTGGEVWVKAGTAYNASYGRITNLRRYVYVYGGFAGGESSRSERDWVGNETILDGAQSSSPVVMSVAPGYCVSTVDGFKVYNGRGSNGAGIYCDSYSSPAIVNNNITGNSTTGNGGGIYCYYSSPSIVNNKISGNSASSGGGVYCLKGSPVIKNNTLDNNTVTSDVGGIYCEGRAVLITKNVIKNHQYSGAYNAQGGGVFCNAVRSATITANRFDNNTGWYSGGAIYLMSSPKASVINNLFVSCFAKNGGGGAIKSYQSYPRIINNTFALNHTWGQGGAIGLWENDYSQLAQVINNIFYKNKADNFSSGHSAYSAYGDYYVNLRYCDAYSDEGTGSSYHYSGIYADSTCKYWDPDFCEVTGENPYWLDPTSPVRGIGQNPSSNPLVPVVDIYSLPRPGKNGTTDPGPYEDGPFVRIASPQDGTMYGDDLEQVVITAETSGDAASVSYTATKVGDPETVYEFGPVSTAPYRVTWSYPPEGCYELVATAGFAGGTAATSAPVLISIKGFCYPDDTQFDAISPYQDGPGAMSARSESAEPKWLKGAFHVHWYDDFESPSIFGWQLKHIGTKSKKPSEVASIYRNKGYDFIAMTEHNHLTPPRGSVSKDFVWLENCEEITPTWQDGACWAAHILGIGLDGHYISGQSANYDISKDTKISGKTFGKWPMPSTVSKSDYEFVSKTEDPGSKDYDYVFRDELLFVRDEVGDCIPSFNTVAAMGGLAFVPHPTAYNTGGGWFNFEELVSLYSGNKYQALACYTTANLTNPQGAHWSSEDGLDSEYTLGVTEKVNWKITQKYPKRMLPFTYSEDDYTPGLTAAGKSWIYLKVDDPGEHWDTASNHYRSERIKNAIRKGTWWSCHTHGSASTCPMLNVQVSCQEEMDGNGHISWVTHAVCTSPTAVSWVIRGTVGRKLPAKIVGTSNGAVTSYDESWSGCETPDWIVVIAKTDNGLVAESNPIRLLPRTNSPYEMAMTSAGLVVTYLPVEDYPEEMPDMGVVRALYDVSGDFSQGNTLTLSFAGTDITALGINNLRIFRYDPNATPKWSALTSTLDTVEQTLSAQIPALGIYTISAVSVTDTQAPVVVWQSPSAGATITGSGATDLIVSATDNVGVSMMSFSLVSGTRERNIAEDGTCTDGSWGATVDFSHYVSGSYDLKATATDGAGNVGTASIPVVITTSALAPQLTINQPSFDSETASVVVTGTASDADDSIACVSIELDGQPAGYASLSDIDQTWSYSFKNGTFGPGAHFVKAIAVDTYGNETMQEIATALPLSYVYLSTDSDSQCLVNTPVTLTASATGGTVVEYRFLVWNGTQWSAIQEYGTPATCSWTPTLAGSYILRVYAREQGTTYPEFSGELQFTVAGPLSGVSLSVEPSQRAVNMPVTLYATPLGGSNPEYRFEADSTLVRDWEPSDMCQWFPVQTGTYALTVRVREQGTTSPEFSDTENNYIVTDPLSAVTLGVDPSSPQPINTEVTLTASPVGGGTVEYLFDISNDGGLNWSILRDYDTISVFQWTPTESGTYKLRVTAREQGSEEETNPEAVQDYVITQ